MRRLGALALIALAGFASDVVNPGKARMDPVRLKRIPARMQKFVDDGTAAGFVTLIMRHGAIAELSATGWQDREAKIPMRIDTIFQVMSMTKPMTATAVMILAEEGLLSFNDPISKYLPEFADQKLKDGSKPARPATLRDLATHTSGMPGYPDGYNTQREHTLAEAVKTVSHLPLQFEPGSKWSYSNTGMATLGRIVEVVSGLSYEKFMAERIFLPLGMKDSFFFPTPDRYSRIAAVYTDEKGTLQPAHTDVFHKAAKYPAPEGGLYTTAADLARFYQMMLNHGTLDGHRILSKAAIDTMVLNHTGELTAGFAPGMGYGFGWAVVRNTEGTFRLNSIGTYGHGGAYRTFGWVDPAKDMFGILLFQRTNGGGDLADEITAFMTMAAAAIEE